MSERQRRANAAGQAAMQNETGRLGYFVSVMPVANAVAALWEIEAESLESQLAAAEQERDDLAERVRTLEAALEPLRAKLVSEWWHGDEARWWQSCSVCDSGGPKGLMHHFDDCELGAALAARSSQPEAGAAVEAEA